MPNEFDNVIMVAIVITCRANEKEERPKKNWRKKIRRFLYLILYAPCSREDYTIVGLLAAVYNNERAAQKQCSHTPRVFWRKKKKIRITGLHNVLCGLDSLMLEPLYMWLLWCCCVYRCLLGCTYRVKEDEDISWSSTCWDCCYITSGCRIICA